MEPLGPGKMHHLRSWTGMCESRTVRRGALWLGTPAPVPAWDWSTRDQIPSPNTYSHQWNLGPSLLTCMLHSLPYNHGWWWLFVETSLPTRAVPRALHAPSLRSPHRTWEMGAVLPPTFRLKTWSLSNAVYSCNAYGFSFQRATLEGMGRQWLLFCLSVHNLLGLCSMSRNPSNAAHFSIRDTSLYERYPSGLKHRDS